MDKKEIIDMIENAITYDSIHNGAGWSYEMLKEALIEALKYIQD